jgi:hypothetical protein
MVDIYPSKTSTASASVNMTRCSLGALGVSVLQLGLDGIWTGWMFVIFAGLLVGTLPMLGAERRFGRGWRLEREGG